MKLYKYRTINKFTLINLFLGTVYYPRASELNDPCDAQMRVTKPGDSAMHHNLATELFSEALPPGAQIDREGVSGDLGVLFNSLADAKIKEFCSRGIYSLSEDPTHHLMWSHYADSHRGLCIEYEVNPSDHPFFGPVQYTSSHEPTRFVDVHSDPDSAIRKYYFDKSIPWQYEREWRLLTKQGGALGVDLFKVSALIVGARTPDIDCLAIASLAISRDIPLRRAKAGDDSKEVTLQNVEPSHFATECARRAGIAA